MMSHHHSSAAASVKGGTGLLVGTRQLCHVGKFQASTLLERRIKRHKKVLNRVFGYFRYNRRSCSSNLPGLWDSVKQGVLDTTNSRQKSITILPFILDRRVNVAVPRVLRTGRWTTRKDRIVGLV